MSPVQLVRWSPRGGRQLHKWCVQAAALPELSHHGTLSHDHYHSPPHNMVYWHAVREWQQLVNTYCNQHGHSVSNAIKCFNFNIAKILVTFFLLFQTLLTGKAICLLRRSLLYIVQDHVYHLLWQKSQKNINNSYCIGNPLANGSNTCKVLYANFENLWSHVPRWNIVNFMA